MRLALALTAYVSSIVAANVMTAHLELVGIGFGLLVTANTFAAGFALLARDFVHRYGGIGWALGGIAAGAVISYALATPALALASTVAFAGAELVDLGVFAPLRDRIGFAASALVSNVVSAPLDTLLFFAVAGFPLTVDAVAGQVVAKVVWVTLVPLALYAGVCHALRRESLDSVGA